MFTADVRLHKTSSGRSWVGSRKTLVLKVGLGPGPCDKIMSFSTKSIDVYVKHALLFHDKQHYVCSMCTMDNWIRLKSVGLVQRSAAFWRCSAWTGSTLAM